MRRLVFPLIVGFALLALAPGTATGTSERSTFLLVMDAPNIGVAPNGDRVSITCESRQDACGTFSAHPKSVEASGEFQHTDSAGNVVGAGTWTATELLSFHFYGCRFIPAVDVDLGDDNLCGGAVKMRVTLHTPVGDLPGILTVFCIVGEQAPASHDTPEGEGVTLNVPGLINFTHTGGGENIYIRQ